jgi:hypothetical protein
MRISTALYQAGGNFARGTKFSIIINTPPRLNSIYSKYYDVLCKTTGIPTVTHTPIEMKVKGQNVKIPGRTQQDQNIQITFYLDEYLDIRQMFQEWIYHLDNHNPLNPNEQNGSITTYDDLYGSMTLTAKSFDENQSVKTFTFYDVFPTNLENVNYGAEDKDNILEQPVTFSYSRYETS